MARVFLDNPMMTLSGSLRKSDKYYYVTRNGKTYTHMKGVRSTPLSQNEIDARKHFKRAVDWANMVQRCDETLVHYVSLWHASNMKCKTFRGWLINYYYQHFQNS